MKDHDFSLQMNGKYTYVKTTRFGCINLEDYGIAAKYRKKLRKKYGLLYFVCVYTLCMYGFFFVHFFFARL